MNAQIACTLVAADLAEQGRRWRALAARSRTERQELPNGLRLVFAAGPGVADELEALVAVERDCCAFAAWTLTSDGASTTLDITAEDEAVPVVHAMFA